MKSGRPVWKIEVVTTAEAQPVLAQAIEDNCDALMAFELTPGGPWQLQGITMDEPDEAAIRAQLTLAASGLGLPSPHATIEKLPDVDWLARNRRAFPPIRAGRYFVYGSHYEGPIPPGAVGLKLDASIAFGSGEHATTRGCLLALDRLARLGRRGVRHVLDLGCGSGILALAAAKSWNGRVLAADIDHGSVGLARENVRRNGLNPRRVRVIWSDGPRRLRHHLPGADKNEIVCANILARPLRRLSRDLARTVGRGGTLILSGLLAAQSGDIVAAYRFQRLALVRRLAIDGWHTLVFSRRSPAYSR